MNIEKQIEVDTNYTEKRNKVLKNLTPLENLNESIKVDKNLRERRLNIFAEMYNQKLTKDQVKESKYLNRMFSGEKIKGITFKKACELAKENKIKAVIIESKPKKSGLNNLADSFKKALGLSKDKDKCPICKTQLSKKEKKRKKHISKCNKNLENQNKKTKKKFTKQQSKKSRYNHTEFNRGVLDNYQDIRDRRGAFSCYT